MKHTPRPFYATNARDLLETRQQGMVPAGPVVVSLVGGEFSEPVLYVRTDMPADRLDWRMLVNLDVWLWASPAAPLNWLLGIASRIAAVRPKTLFLRFEDAGQVHDVEVGEGIHRPSIADIPAHHSFTWVPINCCGTLWGARLRKALIATHPRWTEL